MGKLRNVYKLLEGRHFDREVIIVCVRWYLRFKLSLRDLVEMMAERGVSIAHTTIMRWVAALCTGVREQLEVRTPRRAYVCSCCLFAPEPYWAAERNPSWRLPVACRLAQKRAEPTPHSLAARLDARRNGIAPLAEAN